MALDPHHHHQDSSLVQELEALGIGISAKAEQALQDVIWALLYGPPDAKLRAAQDIRRLTKSSPKNRAYLAAAGAISPLVSMLDCASPELQDAALQALLNIAIRNEWNKVQIVKIGALSPLVELLQSENATVRESAAVVILTLSASDANKPIIGNSGATPFLVDMLVWGSLQGKVDAVMALYNLSTYQENLPAILSGGAVPPLVALLKDCKKASKVAERTTALLHSLSVFEEGRSSIANVEGGILALVEVLEEGSLQGREHAVSALLTMCQSSRCKYRQAILQEGAIPGLLELTVQGSAIAKQKAQNLLQLLREPPRSPRSATDSMMLDNIVYDIASHVDNGEPGPGTAQRMLTEMVQRSMEQSVHHLQQRSVVCVPSELTQSKCLADVSTK